MKKTFFAFLLPFLAIISNCQTRETSSKFNLDFEIIEHGLPTGWSNFGSPDYMIAIDSTNVKSGKYSASIEFKDGNQDFKAWGFTLPDNYEGKKITLAGYIKTENITDGYAGLWMRIDPSIAFDNMHQNGVKGTTDWTRYKITLDMKPERTKQIVVGGLLVGKGKMWIDDLNISIDGKEIKNLKPIERKVFSAEKDQEFDKGSQIASIPVDKNHVENLKTLGLIWGFLKYYHPNIAKGEYNWDYELFRILPQILKSENQKTRNEILVKWINSLGTFPEGKGNNIPSSEIKYTPDLDWIKNNNFSNELTALLLKVKNADWPGQHYYIGLQPGVGNPEFKNENAYFSIKYPDAGFRLLALYRYWNIIQYYFPYKNLIEEDWKNVLEEFIPKMIHARNETEYVLVTLELIGRVHDSHANVWGGNQALMHYFGVNLAPLELTFVENKAVVTGYYDEEYGRGSGMVIGDIITKINSEPVNDLVERSLKYTPASNYPTKLRDMSYKLLRTNDTIINVEFIRDEKIYNTVLKTFPAKEINIRRKYQVQDTSFKLIDKEIAYINNGLLKKNHLPEIWKEIKNTKGLILDLRNYPADYLIYALNDYLIPQSKPAVKFTKGSIEHPGLFTYMESLNVGKENNNYYKGEVVILINELTQSSAEFHAMAYRVHPNATVIGSTTAGADGNVSRFYLPGGISTMISGIGVYYPDGKETQRIGIIPDIEWKPTIKGIKEGRDELLEKAIEIIKDKR